MTALPSQNATATVSDFLGKSIPEAAKKLLARNRRQMGNAEIAAALKAGGLVMNSAEPANTVGSILTRRFEQHGDIVKVGAGFGASRMVPQPQLQEEAGKRGER